MDDTELLASHQLMFLAALRQFPVPREVAHLIRQSAQTSALSASSRPSSQQLRPKSRWSMDGWLFLREGRAVSAARSIPPAAYGASQVGAVIRYRLAPGSTRRPTAYVRATAALAGADDREAALGLSVRPVPAVPVSVLAEMRMRDGAGRSEFRPSAFAVTEIPPIDLPAKLRAETYGQAGYVGGDLATPFADGQARITRNLAEFELGTVSAGAGAWGGAQRGAARIDVGPTASVDLRLGQTPARLAVDYRQRVAGDAAPRSGLALTLSSGF